jgi:aryl-alcohol dehydrogenase-like predicted oxidoreductase
MNYRSLGRTGVKVSPLCLGTMNFGYRTDEDTARRIIHQAIDKGINFIDTANLYGQPANDGRGQGLCEEIVGKALSGKRDQVILGTKFYATMDRDDPNSQGGSRRHVIQACEDSLRRLKVDHIDLYQMHRPDAEIPIDETLRALDDLIHSGKVRYIGTSSFKSWQLVEALWESERLGLNRFVTEQPRYNLIDRRIESEVIPVAQKYGIAILAYSPLAGGILSGKYSQDKTQEEESRMSDPAWGEWAASFLSEEVFQLVDKLQEIAAEMGCTPSQLALAWVIQQAGVTSAIIGPRTLEQFEDNFSSLQVELDEEVLETLDQFTATGEALFDTRG